MPLKQAFDLDGEDPSGSSCSGQHSSNRQAKGTNGFCSSMLKTQHGMEEAGEVT
jgi:hypothetical protein